MQPCGLFPLLSCSGVAFPSSRESLVMSRPGKFTEPLLWVKVDQSYQSIMVVAGWIPNRKHEAQALFRERARLSIQYFALQI